MCGIVGAVSTRNIVPDPGRRPAAARIPRLRLLRRRRACQDGGCSARAAPRASPSCGRRSTTSTSKAAPASPTRAGPRTARRPCTTRIRTFSHGPGRRRRQASAGRIALCTTASSRTTTSCAPSCKAKGYVFDSQTDTEVIAHLIDSLYDGDLFEAVQRARRAAARRLCDRRVLPDEPHRVVGARAGSPLVLGVGRGGENFLASDAMALAGVTDQIVYLEEGDVVDLQLGKYWIGRRDGAQAGRRARCSTVHAHSGAAELGPVPPLHAEGNLRAAARDRRHARRRAAASCPSCSATARYRVFKEVDSVLILACGTSYYSRLHRQVLARVASPRSRRRSRSRANTATATACRTRARWSSRSRQSRRDRRHAGRAEARAQRWA